MLLQFKVVSDGSLWSIDSTKLHYARISRTLLEVENPSTEPVIEEFGKLIPQSQVLEVYRLEGRTPGTDGPGGGLTSVCVIVRIADTTLEIILSANVPITDVVSVRPIESIRCMVLGERTQ